MGATNKIDNPPNVGTALGENLLSNLTGVFSIAPMAKFMSGARCVLRMNGKIVGFAFGVSWNIKTDATEIRTIDDWLPYELAPSLITVTGTIQGFRIPGSGPGAQFLQTDIENFLHQRYVEIEVRDSQTNNLIFLTKQALITGRQETFRTGQMAEMTLEFKAIGFADEKPPERAKDVVSEGKSGGGVDVNGTSPVDKLINKAKDAISNLF